MAELRRVKVELWDNNIFYIYTNLKDQEFSKVLCDWIYSVKDENFSCHKLIEFIEGLNRAEIVAYVDSSKVPVSKVKSKSKILFPNPLLPGYPEFGVI